MENANLEDGSRSARSGSIAQVMEEASSAVFDMEQRHFSLTGSMQTSKQAKVNDSHFYSKFNEELISNEQHLIPRVVSRGGVPIPTRMELNELLKDANKIKVMCLTWNINGKSVSSIRSINDFFRKIPSDERPEVFAVALQELPSTTLRFHRQMVRGIEDGIKNTHLTFCWVRKWSQLLIVFIKKHLSLYTSRPEYQFIASNRFSKPFRTKGCIGICFRILQASFVFISCHFSHGNLSNRLLDYKKAASTFNFRCTLRPNSAIREQHSIFNANAVFWFGDLNFRLVERLNTDDLAEKYWNKMFVHRQDFDQLFQVDELRQSMVDNLAFHGFKEANILFPPSYKFIVGTHQYSKKRIPSYTDRILYFSSTSEEIQSVRYDIVWNLMVSDHKAVYGIYWARVLDKRMPFLDQNFSVHSETEKND